VQQSGQVSHGRVASITPIPNELLIDYANFQWQRSYPLAGQPRRLADHKTKRIESP